DQAGAGTKVARLSVRCPLAAGAACEGRLTLVSVSGPPKELARGAVKLKPGSTRITKLRLASAARSALSRKSSIRARRVVTTGRGKKFRLPGRVTLVDAAGFHLP